MCYIKWWSLAVIYISIVSQIVCEQWTRHYIRSKMQISTVRRLPDPAIITNTLLSASLMQCAMSCSIYKSHSLYYARIVGTCYCNNAIDERPEDSAVEEIQYGNVYFHFEESHHESFLKIYERPFKKDCLELYDSGHVNDGVYSILPVGGVLVYALCDMVAGGWTVFQRRQDGSVDFYRDWDDYVAGFGDETGEFWLGLNVIHLLTVQPSELHIFLDTFGDVTPTYANEHYSNFKVSGSTSNFILTADGYSGDCGSDALQVFANGSPFSTYDQDNDSYHDNCAVKYSGAWWYGSCHRSNLNGLYLGGGHTSSFAESMSWYPCWGYFYSVEMSIMKTKRI